MGDTAVTNNTIISYNDEPAINEGRNDENIIISTSALKNLSTLMLYPLTTSIGRKGIFIATMYYGGFTLISTIGIVPVLTMGAIALLL